MGMIVSPWTLSISILAETVGRAAGELVEKTTRVLTPEEQRIFDIEWVGKDGSKRKLEV